MASKTAIRTTADTRTGPDWKTLTGLLSAPFNPASIQWRAGSTSKDKTKALALAYAEPRTYEDRLNHVCPGAWEVTFEPWGEHRIICHLTILGITRSSTGESGDSNPNIAGTSAEAQAFKRACTKFGLGRYLYSLPTQWVDYDAKSKQLTQTPQEHRPPPPPAPGRRSIGPEREKGMHLALSGVGIHLGQQTNFASQVLNRNITRLRDISEEEARAVWNHARALANEQGTTAA